MQINYVLRPDWRYQKSKGGFSFRLWVSYMDKRDDYKTALEVSKDDYDKLLTGKNLSVELRQLRDDLRKFRLVLITISNCYSTTSAILR